MASDNYERVVKMDGVPWPKVLEDIDEKHIEAHKRLRADLADIHARVESNFQHFSKELQLQQGTIGSLSAKANAPIDALSLVMSTKAIVSLIGGVVIIALSYWNLAAKLDQQQKDAAAAAKLQEVQMKALGDAVTSASTTAADAKRQYELLRYEFQGLKDALQKGK